MLFESIKDNVGQHVVIALEDDTKEEVECVLSHISDDKGLSWGRITKEFLKLKGQAMLLQLARSVKFSVRCLNHGNLVSL